MELKTWHFVIALILFTGLIYLLGNWELKKGSPDKMTSYLTELNDEISITDSLSSGLSFVLFHTENSVVCDKMADNLNRVAKNKQHEAGFFRLNLDKYPRNSEKYLVSGVPTVLIMENNNEIKRIMGIVPEKNIEIIYSRVIRDKQTALQSEIR